MTGAPTLIILDECWVFFDNEQFAQKIREWLKVLRKANASVVFATQSLTDIVESPIFSTVLESCPSQIFLPNDKALENCPISLAYVAVNKADNKKATEILEKYGQENFNKNWLEYRNISLPEVETERRRFF